MYYNVNLAPHTSFYFTFYKYFIDHISHSLMFLFSNLQKRVSQDKWKLLTDSPTISSLFKRALSHATLLNTNELLAFN